MQCPGPPRYARLVTSRLPPPARSLVRSPWTLAVAVLIAAYLTGFTPVVETTERCPSFMSPTPGLEQLCHSHLGPDAKFRLSDLGGALAFPQDVPAIQEHHFALRLANLHVSLVELGF